jgi:hypothetical protein
LHAEPDCSVFLKANLSADEEVLMSSTESTISPNPDPLDPAELLKQQQYKLRVRNIAEVVKKQQCVLFLGSAIHVPSSNPKYDYPKTKCPPIGNQLSELLATKCTYPDQDRWNLQRVSSYYEWLSGFRSQLVTEVRGAIHMEIGSETADQPTPPTSEREPSPVLRGLARLGFPIVITTNYDQLYEKALKQIQQPPAPGTPVPESEPDFYKSIYSPKSTVRTNDCPAVPSSKSPYLLKIHGDLDQDDSIVITDEDYIQFVLRMGDKHPYHPVGKNTLYYLTKWPTLFIGYRLNDYNLRLLIKTLRWRMDPAQIPASYSVDMKPDVLIRAAMEKQQYVSFIEKNLWDFVPDLYKEVTGEEMPG